jgi:translation elongation factor EF-G
MEPMNLLSAECPQEYVRGVHKVVHKRGGSILESESGERASTRALLPVKDALGVIGELRAETSGHVAASLSAADWRLMEGNPLQEEGPLRALLSSLRANRHLPMELPSLASFAERL